VSGGLIMLGVNDPTGGNWLKAWLFDFGAFERTVKVKSVPNAAWVAEKRGNRGPERK
jgi:hypothetical protein